MPRIQRTFDKNTEYVHTSWILEKSIADQVSQEAHLQNISQANLVEKILKLYFELNKSNEIGE